MKLFIINGTARTGKDTLIEYVGKYLKEKHNLEHMCISSVGAVKEAALILGWDGVKDEKGRQYLSDLKDMSTAAYDAPMKYMESFMTDENTAYFFMIREPEEIAKFVEKHPTTRTILLTRPSTGEYTNHADQRVEEYPYDFRVSNDGTLEELDIKAHILSNIII